MLRSGKYHAALLSLVLLTGCVSSRWPFIHFVAAPPVKQAQAPKPAETVSVTVIRDDAWASGGPLVFIPFTPGARAEAGAAVDRLALMIVKGAADLFEGKPGAFRLLTDGDPAQASFIIEGRIEEFAPAGMWRFIGIGRKKAVLKVSGDVLDRKTGEVVAVLFGFREFRQIRDADKMAYDLGRAIAEKMQH